MAIPREERLRMAAPWFASRRNLALVILAAFLLIAAAAFFVNRGHYQNAREQALKQDRATAAALALLLEEHFQTTIRVLESYADRPLLLRAVKERNRDGLREHLVSLKGYAGVDSVLITDSRGTLWAREPAAAELLGENFAYRDWYRGVSAKWRPYVSEVFQRIVAEKDLAAVVAVPVFDRRREAVAILAITQRTETLSRIVGRVPVDPDVEISIADQRGNLVYGGRREMDTKMAPYPFRSLIGQAKAKKGETFAVSDPARGGRTRHVSPAPVAGSGWTVYAGRDSRAILRVETIPFLQTTAIAVLLFLVALLTLIYFRKRIIAEQLAERLEAETALQRQSLQLDALHEVSLGLLRRMEIAELFQAVVVRAGQLFGADESWISLYDPGRGDFEFKAVAGANSHLIGTRFAAGRGVAGEVWRTGRAVVVNDYQNWPGRATIEEYRRRRTVAAAPLRYGGQPAGILGIAHHDAGRRLEDGDLAVLERLADLASVAFDNARLYERMNRELNERTEAEATVRRLNETLEKRVEERTTQLEGLNRELEAFSYSVSHDLRAPLRSIDGFSAALLEDYPEKPLDKTGQRYLERIRNATQGMGRLIDDLLKLSRLARYELHPVPVDLSEIVREIAATLDENHPGRNVDVAVQEGVFVLGDPGLLKIALENLIDNAWKFTRSRPHPRIEFGATVEGGTVRCRLCDNGAGFDMAYVDKLFGAFQRLHTAAEFPGSGIGLATVRRIISRHGGEVWAEGQVDRGATFTFTLPVAGRG